jgi:uncharacterized BrkB/YihY/UPF0761 family membrane protein
MANELSILILFVGLVLLALALWLPVRLLRCLWSRRARRAVRRRWLLHILWALFSAAFLAFIVFVALSPKADYTARAKVYEGFALAAAATLPGPHCRRTPAAAASC